MRDYYNLSKVNSVKANSIISYVKKAMRRESFSEDEIEEYLDEIYNANYEYLVFISEEFLDKCNNHIDEDDGSEVLESEDKANEPLDYISELNSLENYNNILTQDFNSLDDNSF